MKPATVKSLLINITIMVVSGTVLVLFFFYIYLPNKTNHGETITVPNVIEANYADLEDLLTGKDLRYEVNDSIYDSKYPPNTVLRQFPKAGANVKEGRKVFVTLNKSEVPTIQFPNFKGKSLTHVKAVMSNLDLKLGKIRRRTGPYFNLVLEVRYLGEPIEEGQEIPKGSELDIVVADGYGKQNFIIANFFGLEFDIADVLIKGQDLNLAPLNIANGIDTTDQAIYIIRQDPLPGTEVNIGEYVELWVDTKRDSAFYEMITKMDSAAIIKNGPISKIMDSLRNLKKLRLDSIQN